MKKETFRWPTEDYYNISDNFNISETGKDTFLLIEASAALDSREDKTQIVEVWKVIW